MFGSLHIEHNLLNMHGELIRGSGLYELLENNEFSIIGTGAVVNANHIKQARYCLQVTLSALYLKLTEARSSDKTNLSPMLWLKEEKNVRDMCFYWHLILKLEIEILLFVRSICDSNFMLYILSLQRMVKWMFALDHFHYARWISIHLFDLMTLHSNCPDIFDQLSKGNFSFKKTKSIFKNGIRSTSRAEQ